MGCRRPGYYGAHLPRLPRFQGLVDRGRVGDAEGSTGVPAPVVRVLHARVRVKRRGPYPSVGERVVWGQLYMAGGECHVCGYTQRTITLCVALRLIGSGFISC